MKIRFLDGKTKALTLSYDDGCVQDIRLVDIMNKYGLKGTFNINSGLYFPESSVREVNDGRLKLSEAISLLKNSQHEIAMHTYNHQFLERLDSSEVIYEITEDRRNLEKEFGRVIRGMAYPYGTYNKLVIDILEKCQIAYARTVNDTYSFKFPDNWLVFNPTCHHNYKGLRDLTMKFVERTNRFGNSEIFSLWGHSCEFDEYDNWNIIEKFAEYVGNRDYIWYATNIEIYDYVKAYKNLQTSYDKKIIHNPSAITLWFEIAGEIFSVNPGETIRI